jgi:hypothetical protein
MPVVDFSSLPGNARIWVFASDRPLTGADAETLLANVDGFLSQWKAHGAPLRSAREWRDDRFLAIGVDPTAEQASGCSIDGLFRGLRELERSLGTTLVAGGRVFYRDKSGRPATATRKDVAALLTADTPVFDTSVTDARAYRERFVRDARDTWVGALLLPAQESQPSSRSATNESSARNA